MNQAAKPAVAYSTFSPESLANGFLTQFDLGRLEEVRFWYRGLNDTYAIIAEEQQYMLRIYRLNWRTPAEVEAELALIDTANRACSLVAGAVADRFGCRVHRIEAPEGMRLAVLFERALGRAVPRPDARIAFATGSILAALHQSGQILPEHLARPRFDQSFLLDRPLELLGYYTQDTPDSQDRLEEWSEGLGACFSKLAQTQASFGLCHGDLHWGNLLVAPDHQTLFDLDFAGYGWRAWDLACYYQALIDAHYAGSRAAWGGFLEGYRSLLQLSSAEEEAVPHLAAIRRLWGHAVRLGTLQGRPTYWFDANHLDGCLAEIERWYRGDLSLQ